MISLLNKKTINTSKTVSKKFKYFRQQTDLDYVGDYFYTNETPSNIFINNTKKEDSSINCRISTFPTERNEVLLPKNRRNDANERGQSLGDLQRARHRRRLRSGAGRIQL